MEELTKITKIEQITTKGYNPRENGITERLNGTIVAMLRRSTVVPVEWDVRLPFCMFAYNITPHQATGESPYFILHGVDPGYPSGVIPNGGVSWYTMDESRDDYKAQLLQAMAEVHDRVKEYNERIRGKMKMEYDRRNKVDISKHPKVGDRVYMLSPKEKAMSAHPKLTCDWAGPFRVIEASENSAVISRIGENVEPIRVQFDMLRIVPPYISDDRIDTVTSRGRRGRRAKVSVNKVSSTCFRGAEIRAKSDKGHLEYTCEEGCLNDVKLGELAGIQFPGAFSQKPMGSLWNAWRAASIFIRMDLDMASKIKFWKDGAVCLDEEALQIVLRVAYSKCLDWTEFICMTDGIRKHEKIESFGFEKTYDSALKKLKKELEEEEKKKRQIKQGPTAFAAPASAALLEKDGPKRGITTRVATSFKQLREILTEWTTHAIWIIVWPEEKNFKEEICEIVKACGQDLAEGGQIVTAWPPVIEKNVENWKSMVEIWSMLGETIKRQAGAGQFYSAAGAKVENGRVFCEIGSPEIALYYYGSNFAVGCAKSLYECIRKKLSGKVELPEIKRVEYQPMWESAREGGGMSVSRSVICTRKRRALGGKQTT
uniref:Integrase catalytic domain-containing protein n=1 Tax=Haemonchus contortus TaxID=6289 RepID=A0A7I4Z3W9_HAECO